MLVKRVQVGLAASALVVRQTPLAGPPSRVPTPAHITFGFVGSASRSVKSSVVVTAAVVLVHVKPPSVERNTPVACAELPSVACPHTAANTIFGSVGWTTMFEIAV